MRPRWTLRQMLLWVFIGALIMPYIVALVRTGFTPLTRFSLSDADLIAWVSEVDPSARVSGGGGSAGSNDSELMDCEYLATMKRATPEDVFSHLQNRCQERISEAGWKVTGSGTSGESFSFVFSNGFSRYRLYVWNVPLTQAERDRADKRGEEAIRIKVLTIGYTSR